MNFCMDLDWRRTQPRPGSGYGGTMACKRVIDDYIASPPMYIIRIWVGVFYLP